MNTSQKVGERVGKIFKEMGGDRTPKRVGNIACQRSMSTEQLFLYLIVIDPPGVLAAQSAQKLEKSAFRREGGAPDQ